MKRKLIIIALVMQTFSIGAQTFLTADSATSEKILRKHFKAKFLIECFLLTGSENPDSTLNTTSGFAYGDFFIRQITYAFGGWALKPDFNVYKLDLKSPWVDYKIYKLKIPRYSSRNDSIAGFYSYGDKHFGIDNPTNPLSGEKLLAFNDKTGMMKYLAWPTGVYFHLSEVKLFKQLYPKLKWDTLPGNNIKKLPILSPVTRDDRKKLLLSELMKNIYSYRIIKSGVRDSLLAFSNVMKENVEQFPLIDSLIPDFDENLYMMDAKMIVNNGVMEYWRFEYPGYDSLYNAKGGRRNRAWEKYMPLQKQFYVVAFELKREIVHFISGNFYRTRFAEYYFPLNSRYRLRYDSAAWEWNRICYVKDRMLSLCPDLYFELKNEWPIDSDGEDENYWYFLLHTAVPYHKLLHFYDDDGVKSYSCCAPPEYRFCDYKVRMNKKNWEIVEIVDTIKCFDK